MSSAITARDVPVQDVKKPAATKRRSRLLSPILMLGGIALVRPRAAP